MSAYPVDEKLGLGTPEETVDLEQRANGEILTAEEAELAKLGYKQEFKREFSWFATFSFAFSISGLLATVCSTLEDKYLRTGYIHFWLPIGCRRTSCDGLVLVKSLSMVY